MTGDAQRLLARPPPRSASVCGQRGKAKGAGGARENTARHPLLFLCCASRSATALTAISPALQHHARGSQLLVAALKAAGWFAEA